MSPIDALEAGIAGVETKPRPSSVCERFCFCQPQTDWAQLARPCLPFAASDQMSTWRASNLRLRRQPRVQSRSKTGFGEFVRVAITQFDLDPTIFDGLVQPSLEIGISHIDEIIASKYAARTNFMLHENVEDLASHFFIRCHVIHPLRVSNRRSHKSNTTASSGMKLYSSCFGTDSRGSRRACRSGWRSFNAR